MSTRYSWQKVLLLEQVLLPLLKVVLRAVTTGTTSVPTDEGETTRALGGSDHDIKMVASSARWARPCSVAVDALASEGPSLPRYEPLGLTSVSAALSGLGLDDCAVFESASQPERPGLMVKTIALLTHETQLLLCVLPLTQRLHMSRCAMAIGLSRTVPTVHLYPDLSVLR